MGRKPIRGLTDRQRQVLRAIKRLKVENDGIPPTYEEIGDRVGLSKQRALRIVAVLAEKNYLVREPGSRRGIRLVTRGAK